MAVWSWEDICPPQEGLRVGVTGPVLPPTLQELVSFPGNPPLNHHTRCTNPTVYWMEGHASLSPNCPNKEEKPPAWSLCQSFGGKQGENMMWKHAGRSFSTTNSGKKDNRVESLKNKMWAQIYQTNWRRSTALGGDGARRMEQSVPPYLSRQRGSWRLSPCHGKKEKG